MANVTIGHQAASLQTPQDALEVAQSGKTTRNEKEVKNTKDGVNANRTKAPGQSKSTPSAAEVAKTADLNQATQATEIATAGGAKRARSADEKETDQPPKKKVKREVMGNNPYDQKCCKEAIRVGISGVDDTSGLVDTLIYDAVRSIGGDAEGNVNLKTRIDKLEIGVQEKKQLLYFALNAALQDDVLMASLPNTLAHSRIQTKRDALMKELGSSLTDFVQNGNLVSELSKASPGISLKHISNLMKSIESEEDKNRNIGSLVEYALKINPKNPDAVLLGLYDKLSALIAREKQAPGSSNLPRVQKILTDSNLIRAARITFNNFQKLNASCLLSLERTQRLAK